MITNPSTFQQEIFKFVQFGRGSAVVVAVAGSGKTSTIVHAANLIPRQAVSTFVAFNKAIAVELSERLPKHVQSKTLNALGFGAWIRTVPGKINVDSLKTRNIVDEMFKDDETGQGRIYSQSITRLVALAKSVGIVPTGSRVSASNGLTEDSDYNWNELINFYDINVEEGGSNVGLISHARNVLRESIRIADTVIDFDDQLYMPVIHRSRFFQNDFLFVDEAQDVNMVQRVMLRRALKPTGRLIAVGDPYQAIYGFRGADHSAIDNIKDEFSAIELPLSISYRCPRAVVKEAQKYVSHILPSPTAAEGAVNYPSEFDAKQFQATDIIICRCSAPLITMAYKLIRERVACTVVGREIGQGLIALIDKMKAKTIDGLKDKLHIYYEREKASMEKAKQEQKLAALQDKLATVDMFISELHENNRTIPNLKNAISALFSDDNTRGMLRLMTQHKSKGLEAERVFILNFELNQKRIDRPSNSQQQEINLAYVAITRAKSELYYIDLEMFPDKPLPTKKVA